MILEEKENEVEAQVNGEKDELAEQAPAVESGSDAAAEETGDVEAQVEREPDLAPERDEPEAVVADTADAADGEDEPEEPGERLQETGPVLDLSTDMASLLEAHDYDSPSVGDIRTGVIVSISPQGIIVDLGLKRDGLVQPGDLEQLTEEERHSFQLNDEVPVYIVETGQSDRLIVSIQRARLNQDWIHAEEMLESGEVFEAPVIGQNRGGVIVPFGNLRGFVPASHLVEIRRGMDERQRQQVMARIKDQLIPLKVIEVNRRRRRLVLSQREAQKEWQESRKEVLIENLHVGERRVGRVSGLRDFGAFVDLGGADGLIHISELAWHRVKHPREVLRIGQEIEVFVLDLDKGEQRIALSRKRLLPSPWSLAGEKYTINQLVEGKISRIVDYGAFVEVEPGIEGLLHVSQLSRETVQDPRQILQEGETHLLRVISLDTEKQRIGLSLKSVSANEQIQWMAMREAEAEVERAEAEAAAAASEAESRAMVADQPEAVAVTEEPEPESEVEPAAVASTEVESAAAEGAETPSVELVEETTPRAEDHDVEVTAEEPGEAEAVEAEAAEMAADQAATAEELEVETPAETDMMVTENELVEPVEMDEEE